MLGPVGFDAARGGQPALQTLVTLNHTYFEYAHMEETSEEVIEHKRVLAELNTQGKLKIPERAKGIYSQSTAGKLYRTMGSLHNAPNVKYNESQDLITIYETPVYFTDPTLRNTLKDMALYRKLCTWRGRLVESIELKYIVQSIKATDDTWRTQVVDDNIGYTMGDVVDDIKEEIYPNNLRFDIACEASVERCLQAARNFERIQFCNNDKELPCFQHVEKPMWFFAQEWTPSQRSTRDSGTQQFVYFYPQECTLTIDKACVLHIFQGFNIVTALSEASYNETRELIIDTLYVNNKADFGPSATLNNATSNNAIYTASSERFSLKICLA